MRIIFLTLIVCFIAPNSFANENIDKINSFGKKIDNCREIFLKENKHIILGLFFLCGEKFFYIEHHFLIDIKFSKIYTM